MVRDIVIVGSGASLRGFDWSLVPASARIIAVNGAVEAVPRADAFFTLDPSARNRQRMRVQRAGVKYYAAVPDDYGSWRATCPVHRAGREQGVSWLRRIAGDGPLGSCHGLSEDRGSINTGNSAYGALGLAYHWWAERIVLLGVDGRGDYWHEPGGPAGSLAHLPALFASALPQLAARGISVINGSPDSAVTCFLRLPPEAAMEWLAAS